MLQLVMVCHSAKAFIFYSGHPDVCTAIIIITEKYRLFSLSRNKKIVANRPVEEAKKVNCYKRLIFKQFVQVSGLCGPQFLSYLPKHFTHLCRALYGDAISVPQYGRRT